jgi:hypothetical protein
MRVAIWMGRPYLKYGLPLSSSSGSLKSEKLTGISLPIDDMIHTQSSLCVFIGTKQIGCVPVSPGFNQSP